MKKNICRKTLLLGASIIALNIAYIPTADASSSYCRFNPPTCYDFYGTQVATSVCYDSRSGAGPPPPNPFGPCSGWSCSRVICTYLYQNDEISEENYYTDIYFSKKYLPNSMIRGYHYWAIPYVKHMQNNPNGLAVKFIRPLALHRAYEISYKMGVRSKPDYIGKAIRLFEPICSLIGLFVKEQNHSVLYTPTVQNILNDKFDLYVMHKQAREVLQSYNDYRLALAI